jgi:Integrase core domain.
MSMESASGGPSKEDRELVYAKLNLAESSIDRIEQMIRESGQRKVGKGALRSVKTHHYSLKSSSVHVLESSTCEELFALELELNPSVVGYYVQVPCRQVQRLTVMGRKHVSTAHVDFLVFYRDLAELVECKTESWLEKRAPRERDWIHADDRWACGPIRDWAAQLGIPYRVWASPSAVGVYRQNMDAMYAMLAVAITEREKALAKRSLALLQRRPYSIAELIEMVPGFSTRLSLWLLARRWVYGPIKRRQIAVEERFHLCLDPVQAESIDTRAKADQELTYAGLDVTDPVLCASLTDVAKAKERLRRIEALQAEGKPLPRRLEELHRKVCRAKDSGCSALSACITNYSGSGNRTSRLLPEQEEAIETVIARYWHSGKAKFKQDVIYEYERECMRRGVAATGESRLRRRLMQACEARRALNTSGLRGYQAIRQRTDPRYRTLPPVGYGHTLHVDSSDFDLRILSIPGMMGEPEEESRLVKVKFYVGIDGATKDPMAHSLIFGSARSDGLALLIREYVKRHKMLPRVIHLDRGPENTARWITDFCEERGITLRYSPTAGSAWNSLAETAIKQVNSQVAHRLPGSTEPDQKGRKVDGCFKSHRTATLDLERVMREFAEFFYEHLPMIPDAEGRTPVERKMEVLGSLGFQGASCQYDDDFRIQTSIQFETRGGADKRRGLRTSEGWFCSDELLEKLRSNRHVQVRSDCADPSLLYVLFPHGQWVTAFHSRVQQFAQMTEAQRLAELLLAPYRRGQGRRKKEKIAGRRHAKRVNDEANIATAGSDAIATPDVTETPVGRHCAIELDVIGDAFEEGEEL